MMLQEKCVAQCGKNPKSVWWDDVVKAAQHKVLDGRDENVKDEWEFVKSKVKRCRYQQKGGKTTVWRED